MILSLAKKMPKDFSTVYFFNMFAKGFQAVLSILIIRSLTITDYASYTMFITISSTVLGVIGQSFSLAYVRYNTEKITSNNHSFDTIYFLAQIINMVSFILLVFASYIVQDSLNIPNWLLVISIVYGFFLSVLQLNIAFFQSRERYSKSGIIENSKQITLLLCILASVVVLVNNLRNILFAYIIAIILALLFSFYYMYKPYKKGEYVLQFDKAEMKLFLSVSVWLILYNVVMQMFNQVDISMLNSTGETVEVAQYGVAYKYYNIIMMLLPSIKTVLRVRMSKSEMTTSVVKQKEFALKWMKKTWYLFGGGVLISCIGAKLIFPYLNGTHYNGAIIVFQILSISAFLGYLLAPSVSLVMSLGKYKTQFIVATIAMIINVIGNAIMIPKFGAAGAAITTTISHFFLNGVLTLVILKKQKRQTL